MYKLKFLASVIIFCVFRSVFPQGGPPMITDDPAPVLKGHWETNIGFTLEHNQSAHIYELPLIDLNYGLSRQIQLKAEIPFIINHELGDEPVRGIGKMNLGVKWKFLESEEHHVLAGVYPQILFNITSSSSHEGLTDEGFEFFLPLAFEKGFRKNAFVAQVGRFFESRGSGEWFYGMLLNHEMTNQFELAGEIFGYLPSDFSDNETFLNFGLRAEMTRHLRFLFSAGKNVIKSKEGNNTVIAFLGFQFNL